MAAIISGMMMGINVQSQDIYCHQVVCNLSREGTSTEKAETTPQCTLSLEELPMTGCEIMSDM